MLSVRLVGPFHRVILLMHRKNIRCEYWHESWNVSRTSCKHEIPDNSGEIISICEILSLSSIYFFLIDFSCLINFFSFVFS